MLTVTCPSLLYLASVLYFPHFYILRGRIKKYNSSHNKYSTQLCLMLYLPLDSHLKLYISYKLAAVL